MSAGLPEAPAITITVHGVPAPQGSKRHVGGGVMVESSKGVRPWRQDVVAAALAEAGAGWVPLDGPLLVSMVVTVRDQPASRPSWWPKGAPWSRAARWRPASMPDLSKLARSTEDALTTARIWRDDARVVEYRPLSKHYIGDPAPDVLGTPGAVVRIWRLP